MTAIKVNLDVLLLTTVHLMKQKSHREFDSESTYISLILTVMYSHFMYFFPRVYKQGPDLLTSE